jgi:malonyl CoA-acyl carrier protein transacylase
MLNDYISDKKYKNILDSFDNHLFKHTNFQISQLMSFIKDEPDQEIKRKASILHLTEISQPAILLLSIVKL